MWIAGPVEYRGRMFVANHQHRVCDLQWLFISQTSSGAIRRWALVYHVETRKFALHQRQVSQWDTAHADELAAFYRPIATLRTDLPKRSLLSAMRDMLPDKEIAIATATSVRGGVQ